METHTPEFYLVSGEGPVIAPRACYILRRLSAPAGAADFLLVKIVPPLRGDFIGVGKVDLDEVVLVHRQHGPIYPADAWPRYVHICRILNAEIKQIGKASATDLLDMFWGKLWPTWEEAETDLITLHGSESPRV